MSIGRAGHERRHDHQPQVRRGGLGRPPGRPDHRGPGSSAPVAGPSAPVAGPAWPWVTLMALVGAVVMAAAGLAPSQPRTAGTGVTAAGVTAAGPGLPIVPISALGPISAVLGRDLPGYRIEGLTATNPEQRLRAEFSSRGVTVISARLRLGLALVGFGYAGALRPVPPVAPVAQANRVTYTHGALSEWWANGPAGLEQGFTLSSRPAARRPIDFLAPAQR